MAAEATPQSVMSAYADLINRHDFSLLVPLISEDATFWFSSGTYSGLEAARIAFERTWQRLANETYWLEDIEWIACGPDAACCVYTCNWRATLNGQPTHGRVRGTTVLANRPEGWRIVHEHLSAFPN
jgi:ketosteroid isomerase-like protein